MSEHYSHGYDPRFVAFLSGRSAQTEAAFFAPHLRAGMDLLDCGCGPGVITLGLAGLVAPGQVVGVDIADAQLTQARERAIRQGVTNVRFQNGTVYDLPFPDASFDAVFAHTLVQHLSNPLRGLQEMRRVLKPGGVIGLREEDDGTTIVAPADPLIGQARELYRRVWRQSGGEPDQARNHRALLRAAGFADSRATATTVTSGTAEQTAYGAVVYQALMEAALQKAIENGWTDQAAAKQMSESVAAWGRHPDAFYAVTFCEAVAWKP